MNGDTAQTHTGEGGASADFLGLRFARLDLAAALDWVRAQAGAPVFRYLVTPNVDHMVRLHREADSGLWQVYRDADMCLCDSRILAGLARASGLGMPVVAGSDLTARLLSRSLPDKTRIALIGGSAAQREWLAGAHPAAEIVHHQPPMGLRINAAAQAETAEFIECACADIVLFTVGAPQSEIVAHLVKSRGKARGVALCVGASLEFLTGEKRRAPRLLQAMSMEWAFRLLSEPRRLWRRYLIEGPAILAVWLRWRRSGR